MDEQNTHVEDELDLATVDDDAADTTASDTNEQNTDSKAEQKQDTLDLEESKQGKAEIARDAQAEGWAKKIASGEKSLDDMPANLKWLKPFVEAKLGVNAPDMEKMINDKFSEKESESRFKSLKDDLESIGLSSQEVKALKQKFVTFRSKGLSKVDSLELAKEALNINPQEKALEARRQAMRLRTPGFYAKAVETSPDKVHEEAGYAEVAKSLSPEKRIAYLKGLKRY